MHTMRPALCAVAFLAAGVCAAPADDKPARPNIILILADDMGFSDLGCYGSEIATPNIDRLAAHGLRFTQFYNAARCCPTRAALLTGLYPHQAGVGHMLGDWAKPAYTSGLNDRCVTIAELLREAGYRTYMVGKWHVGQLVGRKPANRPLDRGFEHFYGTGGGGNYFAPEPLMRDNDRIEPGADGYYVTDDFSEAAVRLIGQHVKSGTQAPFFLHLCYTAPHFPLQAKPDDIARNRGRYKDGWDALRARRYARQKELGIIDPLWPLSPRDPVAQPWADATDKEEWDLRMAVYAAMIECMDRGVGRVVEAVHRAGMERNTLILFLSDNGASAEFLDTWPNPARGHKPGSITGTKESHRCLEVGWANAANTPFREHKMWVHEGGIATPLIACWPGTIRAEGSLTREVGHVIDLMPTCLELAGATYPREFHGRELTPPAGRSLVPVFRGGRWSEPRTLYWEHEGNRAIRKGDWKLVGEFRGPWELYDMRADRTETKNLAAGEPERVKALAAEWQTWADKVGVIPWEKLPGGNYRPSSTYRRKSEPVAQ